MQAAREVEGLGEAAIGLERIPVLLVAAGMAHIHAAEGDGSTPLHWAVYNDDVNNASRLLRDGLSLTSKPTGSCAPFRTK